MPARTSTYELAVGDAGALRHLPKLHGPAGIQKIWATAATKKPATRYFIEKGFDIVVLLHGDGQYAPEILSHLYHPIVKGEANAIFGSRMMKTYGGPLKGGMPLYKYAGNRILTIMENRALDLKPHRVSQRLSRLRSARARRKSTSTT